MRRQQFGFVGRKLGKALPQLEIPHFFHKEQSLGCRQPRMLIVCEQAMQSSFSREIPMVCARKQIENQKLLICSHDTALQICGPSKTALAKLLLNQVRGRLFVAAL